MTPAPSTSAFALKIAAIVGMTCNHVANVFAAALPGWLVAGLCTFGGLTFPIMAFLLCEGYRHTSNVRRYAGRLAVFAVLSQAPFSLLWGATASVMVTLLIGLGLLWAGDHVRNRALYGVVLVGGIALSAFCDWGIVGPIMICLFHALRERPGGIALTMLVGVLAMGLPLAADVAEQLTVESPWDVLAQTALGDGAAGATTLAFTVRDASPLAAALGGLGYYTIGFGLATLLLTRYDGRRGRPLKWFFYAYYPAHLLALWAIAMLLGS